MQQKSLFVAAWWDFLGAEQAAHARSWDVLLSPCQKCRRKEGADVDFQAVWAHV